MRVASLAAMIFAVLGMIGVPEKAQAGLFISINVAPPALPIYDQPPIPGPGYMWSPGYWAWDDEDGDYYWVPGAWVMAPQPGLLWTPGYWGWHDGVYAWNAGYWGPHIGFYGGVSYGFGYTGVGFAGGYWSGGSFFYNRSVMNVGGSVTITNVYNKTVINNNVTHVSFNGGPGGLQAHATSQEMQAAHEQHFQPTQEQLSHQSLARSNPDLKAANCHGNPKIAAVGKAGNFGPGNVYSAKRSGGPVNPASSKTGNGPNGTHQAGNNLGSSNHPSGSNGPGNRPFTANQGLSKNANANLNAGSNSRPNNVHPGPQKGMPPKNAMIRKAPPPPPHNAPHPQPQKKNNQH